MAIEEGGVTVTLRSFLLGKAEEVEREDDRMAGDGPLRVRLASGGGAGGIRVIDAVFELALMESRSARLGVSWSGVREVRVIGLVGFEDSHSRMAERSYEFPSRSMTGSEWRLRG